MRRYESSFGIALLSIFLFQGSVTAQQPAATVVSPERDSHSSPQSESGSFPRFRRLLGRLRSNGPASPATPQPGDVEPVGPLTPAPVSSNPPAAASPAAAPSITPSAHAVPVRDLPVRRAQAGPADVPMQFGPGVAPPLPVTNLPTNLAPAVGAQSISLESALYGALTSNPDLATVRLGNPTTPSAESVEVARHFPTTLNPTLWFDLRPLVLIPPDTFVSSGRRNGPYYHVGQVYFYFSLRQPLELGHQTTHRYHVAKAAYEQQQWNVLQAELLAIVQTYRFFQTAEYRREKLKVARELAQFNERLLKSLERRLEANQVLPADVIMAKVEGRATRQLESAAEQDYVTALTDLRNQLGIPDSAGSVEPFGDFTLPPYIPPANEQDYIQMALESRPDIHAAQALVRGTKAAEMLARGDQIPSPIVGPQYEIDEVGVQYFGFVYVTSLPIWNTGKPLVRQRQAEHNRAHLALQQAQQRAVAQVRSALAKWNGASRFVTDTQGLTAELSREVSKMEDLFDKGQVDLTKLLTARQRLIQLKSAEIDSIWAATQAQADLLLALGAPALLQRMLSRTENAARAASSPPALAASPFTPAAPTASAPVTNQAR